MSLPAILRLLVLITLFVGRRTGADIIPPWPDCGPSPPPSPAPSSPQQPAASPNAANGNSVFQLNLDKLLDAIPSSASAAGGFASLSTGGGGDRAFVRGLCFGHALGECQGCLINAAANIASACKSGRRAATWYEGCFLSYADTNASTGYDEGYRYELRNRYFVSDKTAFEKTYEALMSRLIARAVNGSSEPTSSPVPMFATGHAVFDSQTTHNGTMYGLVQCMRDRSAAECGKCLQDSVRQLPRCCYGNQGGVVLGYNCYLRMEIYTYYDLALDAPPLAPSPSSFMPASTVERQGELPFTTSIMHYSTLFFSVLQYLLCSGKVVDL
jgi:hypothetical protein